MLTDSWFHTGVQPSRLYALDIRGVNEATAGSPRPKTPKPHRQWRRSRRAWEQLVSFPLNFGLSDSLSCRRSFEPKCQIWGWKALILGQFRSKDKTLSTCDFFSVGYLQFSLLSRLLGNLRLRWTSTPRDAVDSRP